MSYILARLWDTDLPSLQVWKKIIELKESIYNLAPEIRRPKRKFMKVITSPRNFAICSLKTTLFIIRRFNTISLIPTTNWNDKKKKNLSYKYNSQSLYLGLSEHLMHCITWLFLFIFFISRVFPRFSLIHDKQGSMIKFKK